ncbi:TetR/AcrR family transcriptional regulator [Streptomyces sp. NPDC051561]|uniref:TetR/AcrR family transcriptional regulator n=1 Tax=Streptomyces sp. NPDC051561 TaxID=3365658 RepID=UPI0037B30ED8
MASENSLRERLVDAGVDLVMTEGAASLGLREIARRAGVSHGAPRRYFPTHHSLLAAIARRGFADLEARCEAALSGVVSPREQVRLLSRTYLRHALEHRGMFELMFRHDLLDSEAHGSPLPRLRESTLPMFAYLVELVGLVTGTSEGSAELEGSAESGDSADSGRKGAPPAAVTALALWANLHGMAQLWAWGSLQLALGSADLGKASEEEQLDRLVGAVLDAHLGPVSP